MADWAAGSSSTRAAALDCTRSRKARLLNLLINVHELYASGRTAAAQQPASPDTSHLHNLANEKVWTFSPMRRRWMVWA